MGDTLGRVHFVLRCKLSRTPTGKQKSSDYAFSSHSDSPARSDFGYSRRSHLQL